jgi:hypothetical protein
MPRTISALLLCAAAGFALGASGLAAMSAVGPLLFGVSLIVCEGRARKFRKVRRLADLLGPATALGQARARLDGAELRAHRDGELLGLARRSEGFFFEDAPGPGEDLNLRLARIVVARRQLALQAEAAVSDWISATAHRDVVRAAALLFVCFALLLCAFEPSGAQLMFFVAGPVGPLRLFASLFGGGVALAGLAVAGRAATIAASRGVPARPALTVIAPQPQQPWPDEDGAAPTIAERRAAEPASVC